MARKKKKFSKKRMIVLMSLRGLLLLFIGFSVSVIIAISQIDPDNFRKDITDGLSSAIGMPVEIDGDLSWRLSLRPRAEMTSVVVRNSDWAQNEYGINISSISVVLDPFALITRRPAMREIRLVNPIIYIEENESGDMSMSASVNQRYRVAEYNGSGAPEQFPFNINLGFEVLEIINLQITHITPNATEVYSFDRMRIRARNLPHAQELDGFVQSGGSEYKFAARFSELDTERRIFPVRIAIADRGAPLVINAALEAASRIPIDFTINGTIIDFQRMARIANLDIPEIPRFDINMRGGFGHSELKIHRGSLRVGTNDINITGEFNWSSGRTPTINATIAGNNINLMQVMPDLYRPSSVAWERPDRDLHVFKDVPLHAHLLRMANINLVLDIRNLIVYRELAVRYIDARATLYDGHLTARANAEMGGGGDIDAKVIGFEQDGRIFATAGGRGRNIIVGDLLTELRTHNFMTGLPSSFDVYLESNGAELSELMANLNGQVRGWTTGRGRALRDLTDYLYGRDLLTTVRSGVESVVRRGNTDITHVNCAAVNLKIRNGRAETERGNAIETTDVNLRMIGYADLARERIRVSMVATPTTGIRMSLSGNMINSMEIVGSMAEPEIRVNRGAVAGRAITATGLGLVLAPFTGGLSIAAGAGVGLLTTDILTNWLADDNPCRTALSNDAAPVMRNDPDIIRRNIGQLVDEFLD